MTGGVSVLVPWRPDGADRDQAWDHVRRWWGSVHSGWQVVTGRCPEGPWRKAAAVADAAARADGDLLVIADADVICEHVPAAVAAVTSGVPWAIPHRRVYRLTRAATGRVLAGGELPNQPARCRYPPYHQRYWSADVAEAYEGTLGGGMVVLPRTLLAEVPMDCRFTGWGQEDSAWAYALTVLAGEPWRGSAPLWHLWHPPQPRISRAIGSVASEALHYRYKTAATPTLMRALLDEIPDGSC